MKFKNAREVRKDSTLLPNNNEEEFGCDYNHIVANHYSLKKYIKENKISLMDALNINVICKIVMYQDSTNKHLKSEVMSRNRMQKSQVFETSIHIGNLVKPLYFKEGTRMSVPLLYLITDGFSLNKELIFQTRVYEDNDNNQSSSGSMKKIRKNQSLLEDSTLDIIESSMVCKAHVFFIPLIMANGDPVDWFIPNGDIDHNRETAKRLYEESVKYDFKKSNFEDNSDQIVDDDEKSDNEIIKFIKSKKASTKSSA